jgi:hypothetical protein
MTFICFGLAGLSVAKGERHFSTREWAFLVAGCPVFLLYLFTKEPNTAAVLTTVIDGLGFGPTFTRGWSQPRKDSVISFALKRRNSYHRCWQWKTGRSPLLSIPQPCSY